MVRLRSTPNETSHHSTVCEGDEDAIDGERARCPEMPRRALKTAREKARRQQQDGVRGGREGRDLPAGAGFGLVGDLRSQVEHLEVGTAL